METLIGLLLVGAAAWWFFNAGKRLGSRKGFGVGRSRTRAVGCGRNLRRLSLNIWRSRNWNAGFCPLGFAV